MKILFVQTGGTIDKDYPRTTNGWGFEISEEPAFRRLLKDRLSNPPPSFGYECLSVCRKDSTELTDSDRSELVRCLEEAIGVSHPQPPDGIVITHGTDTMEETARYLAEAQAQARARARNELFGGVPVLITGAMRPERFSNSDADFNLGMAVGAIQLLPPGFVGICMHGRVLRHDDIHRDLATGQFGPRSSPREETNGDGSLRVSE
mmetsp:Transcript_17926/g.41137  ORF Transcript_17926/g.41137 Transcript_17926/m.41137 type:complete len:206 (-) Transcript_17926:36-653(-)|eukprot:CAMPEP_0172395904 /NCGR_PEP_ID=MMETSP1061-20121228/22375_1 /TAXON_ID=37318 /ORGANISM="Pseudo-nitzschia pungens, Strain cf. pungens" /LENGTH=205 /DNA_ID=CAMNT_0013127621 /DNA_START=55 /DNA_END=672 /DNA_ORIENTATION=-